MDGNLRSMLLRLKSGLFMAIMVMIIVTMTSLDFASAEIHYVGGTKNSWAPNINFSDWSSHEQFHLGDWLYFGYNKYQFNVLEVNETSYENCIDKDFISNITKGGGRDVFQLTQLKTYYFLSGSSGGCYQGLRVAVEVREYNPPVAAPSPLGNGSPAVAIWFGHIITCDLVMLLFIVFHY